MEPGLVDEYMDQTLHMSLHCETPAFPITAKKVLLAFGQIFTSLLVKYQLCGHNFFLNSRHAGATVSPHRRTIRSVN